MEVFGQLALDGHVGVLPIDFAKNQYSYDAGLILSANLDPEATPDVPEPKPPK